MTHADFNDLETRDYIFVIGDRGKGIQARYDENTDALIFPRTAFDYVYNLLKEALSQEPTDAVSREAVYSILKEYHIDEEEIESAMDECQNLTVNAITSDVSLLPSVTQK